MNQTLKLFLIFLLSISFLQANDNRALKLKKMQTEQRVALVIGNQSYKHLSQLKSTINDSRSMKRILTSQGFKVFYKENATKIQMKKLLKKFTVEIAKGGVGLYYFAGHGVNVDGKNYLIGVDSLVEEKDEVEYETLALNYVTKKMKNANNRLNIVILDACRNNPFDRSGSGGLAPIGNARGMFVAYATEAGDVASDGRSGKNGIFTKYLIENMKIKGASIEKVFKNTRADVYDATNGKQSPGVYNQIRGDFYFVLPTSATVGATPNSLETNEISSEENFLEMAKAEKMYNVSCKICHATSMMGAHAVGDADVWHSLMENGSDQILVNAINGLGGMPPKGGNTDLSDEDMKLIVDFMIDTSIN